MNFKARRWAFSPQASFERCLMQHLLGALARQVIVAVTAAAAQGHRVCMRFDDELINLPSSISARQGLHVRQLLPELVDGLPVRCHGFAGGKIQRRWQVRAP
jgi:hypothetical protein